MTDSVEELLKLYGPAASTEDMTKPSSTTPKQRKKKERKDRADAEAAAILAASSTLPVIDGESAMDRFTRAMAAHQAKVGLIPTIPPAEPPQPKRGRPTTITSYPPETFSTLFELLMEGYSLNRICMRDDMPGESTVRRWAMENPSFYANYARARELGVQARADRLRDEMATNPDPVRAKLLFEHDKWYFAKMMPKVYGERSELHTTQTVEIKHTIDASQLSPEAMEALEGVLIEAKALPTPDGDKAA